MELGEYKVLIERIKMGVTDEDLIDYVSDLDDKHRQSFFNALEWEDFACRGNNNANRLHRAVLLIKTTYRLKSIWDGLGKRTPEYSDWFLSLFHNDERMANAFFRRIDNIIMRNDQRKVRQIVNEVIGARLAGVMLEECEYKALYNEIKRFYGDETGSYKNFNVDFNLKDYSTEAGKLRRKQDIEIVKDWYYNLKNNG